MGFHRFRGNVQLGGDLARGIVQANQGCYFLLARGERLPAPEVFPLRLVIAKGIAQDLVGDLFGGALLSLRKGLQRAQGIYIQGKICWPPYWPSKREPIPDFVYNPLKSNHMSIL